MVRALFPTPPPPTTTSLSRSSSPLILVLRWDFSFYAFTPTWCREGYSATAKDQDKPRQRRSERRCDAAEDTYEDRCMSQIYRKLILPFRLKKEGKKVAHTPPDKLDWLLTNRITKLLNYLFIKKNNNVPSAFYFINSLTSCLEGISKGRNFFLFLRRHADTRTSTRLYRRLPATDRHFSYTW